MPPGAGLRRHDNLATHHRVAQQDMLHCMWRVCCLDGHSRDILPALKPAEWAWCAQVYALSFFLIPALRWVSNAAKNRVIEGRNDSRAAAAKALRTPSPVLQRKLDRCSYVPFE